MAETWTIEGPKVLDVGGEASGFRGLKVGIVGGRVDVVTHDDSPPPGSRSRKSRASRCSCGGTAPGSRSPGEDSDSSLIDRARSRFEGIERNRVVISVSDPAGRLRAGQHGERRRPRGRSPRPVKASTVSGSFTIDDIVGNTDVNTVSGDVECQHIRGHLRINSVSGMVTARQCDLPSVGVLTSAATSRST